MSYCKRYAKVAWKYNAEKRRVELFRLRCWQWSCPYCAHENRKAWRKALLAQLSRLSGQWWLMTLTARADTRGRLESYKNLQRGIDVLFKVFKRVFGEIIYVRVFEKHPTSEALHAHFIISGLADYVRVERKKNGKDGYTATNFRQGRNGYWSLRNNFVKKIAQKSGMGYIADIKYLAGEKKAVRYVTEYMTKDAQDFDIRGLRHVATSRHVKSPRQRGKNTKILCLGHAIPYSRIPRGFSLLDRDTGEVVGDEYWAEQGFYPPNSDRLTS